MSTTEEPPLLGEGTVVLHITVDSFVCVFFNIKMYGINIKIQCLRVKLATFNYKAVWLHESITYLQTASSPCTPSLCSIGQLQGPPPACYWTTFPSSHVAQ